MKKTHAQPADHGVARHVGGRRDDAPLNGATRHNGRDRGARKPARSKAQHLEGGAQQQKDVEKGRSDQPIGWQFESHVRFMLTVHVVGQ